jgi:hypothetical protein
MQSFLLTQRRATRFGVALAMILALPALARAEDVRIDSLKVGNAPEEVEFKGIEVLGSSLSRDEVAKLFARETSGPDRVALAAKLKATSASIAEISPKAVDAGNLTIRGVKAETIADGKIARLSIGGFDGQPLFEGRPATVKGGSMTMDEIDLSTLLKAAQTGSFDDAAPKAARVSWNGFELTFPDKDTPADVPGGNMVKVTLGAFDGQSTYQGNIPLQSTGGLRNLAIQLPKGSEAGKTLAALGFDKLDFSLTYRGAFDPARKLFQLDDLTVSGVNIGAVGLRAELGNLAPDSFHGSTDQKMAALMNVDLASTEVRVVNAGAFEKALAFVAQQQGAPSETLKTQWSAMATQLVPMMLGGDASATQVGAAIASFINNPKSLTVTIKGKTGPVKIANLAAMSDPTALLQLVNLSAVAEGAPAGAAPAAAAPRVAQVAPQAAQAARKLTGLDAWAQIVGNSITGKSDDGDPLTEYYLKDGTLKQLVDDEITKGKWTLRGQQVCMVYGDDDDDDEECYKLEVSGDVATFTDSDGKGKRYTIVKGNPKQL